MSKLKKTVSEKDGIEQGFAALQTEVNIELFNDIFAFIVKTTAVDAVPVIRNLEACHPWYSRSGSRNIQEQYGFRYFGELLERFEDRAGSGIADIRAIALAMAWGKELLTADMFVGSQQNDFIGKITAMSAGDSYLKGALYLLDKDGRGKTPLAELEQSKYTRTEELLFVLSLYDDFGQAIEVYKPQLLALVGASRSIPVYGNVGLMSWLIKRLDTILKGCRAKDMALFRALYALPTSFVKAGDRYHTVLMDNGYTTDEIVYMNSCLLYFRPLRYTIDRDSIVAEKIAAQLCKVFINSEKTHTQEVYGYLGWLLSRYDDFTIKIQGYTGLFEAIKNEIQLINPRTFIWLYGFVNESYLFDFDILDDKWDILSKELNAKAYRELFNEQLKNHREEIPEKTKERIGRYDSLTGSSYLLAFENAYEYDDTEFALLVNKGILDLATAYSACPGLETLHEDTGDDNKPPILRYIRNYVKGIHSRESFEFMRAFFRDNNFDEMHRLFSNGSSYYRSKTAFFKDELYKGPRHNYSDKDQRFNIKRPFLSNEEHRELFGWLDDYMFRYDAASYAVFSALMLLDPFIPTLFSSDELRRIYDMVIGLGIDVIKDNRRELKEKYLTEAEQKAEKDAEAARQIEQKRIDEEKVTQEMRKELEQTYDGSFKSLLKYLDKHDYSIYNREKYSRLASEYLGKTLLNNSNKLARKEIGRFLQFAGKLVKNGTITYEELKAHILLIEEVADHAANS